MLVRSTKRPSNRASASILARSMTKPSPAGVFRKRRKPLLATSALSPWASLRSRPATSSARAAASFSGFFVVAADDIAPPGNCRFADRQFGLAPLAWDDERYGETVILDHLGAHLAAGAFAHAEDVVDLLGFEGGDGVGADHAAVGDNASLGDPKALAQPPDDRQEQGHVGGIAGQQERGDRPVGIIEHDAEHDLLQMPAVVLGVTVLAQAVTAGAFEPQ